MTKHTQANIQAKSTQANIQAKTQPLPPTLTLQTGEDIAKRYSQSKYTALPQEELYALKANHQKNTPS